MIESFIIIGFLKGLFRAPFPFLVGIHREAVVRREADYRNGAGVGSGNAYHVVIGDTG